MKPAAASRLPAVVTGLLLVLHAALLLTAALRDASVADEHPHALSGYLCWTSGRFSGGIDNPPLGQLWIAAPLALLDRAGHPYRFPDDAFLLAMRLPSIVATLLLGALLAAWGRRLAGAWGGTATLAAFVLEPNVLAHGHLSTLDAPVTLAWWAALWCFRAAGAASARIGWKPLLAFAVACTLAAYTKFTALLLWPSCAAALACVAWRDPGRWRGGAKLLGVALGVAVVASYAVYAFEPLRAGLPQHLVEAAARKLAHRDAGHAAYLLGEQSLRGFLHYYPIVLLVKTPLPLLILAVAGACIGWRRVSAMDRALICVPALLVLVVFTWMRVHIGVRHVLMVYPALVLCAGAGAVELWRRGRAARGVLILLAAAWLAGVGLAAPRWVSYFNVVGGGGRHGDRWLLDSNLDWGQDDARLERFLAASAESAWQVNPAGTHVQLGRIVVNANTLHGLLRPDRSAYWWLRRLEPDAYAGDAWRAWDLDVDVFAARARAAPDDVDAQAAHAEALFQDGQVQAAIDQLGVASRAFGDVPRLVTSAAWMHFEQGQPDRAQAWIERGLRRNPEDEALQQLHQRAALELALVVAPAFADSVRAAWQLGLWWANAGDIEPAMPALALAASGREPEAVAAYSIGLAQRGRFAEAAEVLASAGPGFDVERAALHGLLATEREVQAAERGGPSVDPVRAFELALTYFETRRYDAAAGVLVQLLRQAPDHGDALALLGEIHVRVKLRLVHEMLTPRPLRPEERR